MTQPSNQLGTAVFNLVRWQDTEAASHHPQTRSAYVSLRIGSLLFRFRDSRIVELVYRSILRPEASELPTKAPSHLLRAVERAPAVSLAMDVGGRMPVISRVASTEGGLPFAGLVVANTVELRMYDAVALESVRAGFEEVSKAAPSVFDRARRSPEPYDVKMALRTDGELALGRVLERASGGTVATGT